VPSKATATEAPSANNPSPFGPLNLNLILSGDVLHAREVEASNRRSLHLKWDRVTALDVLGSRRLKAKMSGQIFISYRREESRWSARSLYDRLTARFDQKQVFMDIDGIALGDDFVKEIENRVGECDVLIAVIGVHWLSSKDEHEGRRLDNPEDFVRMEIATALKRDIRVIPVLVDGAMMPRSTDLPDDLKALVRRNALRLSETGFNDDCRRLIAAIEQVLEQKATERREREEKERKILSALADSRFTLRSVSGISKDTHLAKFEVEENLNALIKAGLAGQKTRDKGPKWYVTEAGRRALVGNPRGDQKA
jgi:hypothetical protein